MKKILILLSIVFISYGCRKKDDVLIDNTPNTGASSPKVKLLFRNVVNGQTLKLNTTNYTNAHGDTFSVSIYKYYISNITLTKDDGKVYTEPNSYHLIDEAGDSTKFIVMRDLVKGNYTQISFLIGVDRTKNTSGAQTGALDPINGMFWDWNQGYIMAKMEGNSPQASATNHVIFHLGGFSGPKSSLRWVTLKLPTAALVDNGREPVININSDVAEWFKTPTVVNFATTSIVSGVNDESVMIADNYQDMFTIDHIDN